MVKIEEPNKLECLRCGHKWVPRTSDIKTCPKCRSPYWNEPKKSLTPAKTTIHIDRKD